MKSWIVFFSCVVLLLACRSVSAGYGDSVSRKADRGFSNLLGGWLEIPYQTCAGAKERGIVAGAPIGLAKGICLTPLRMLSGVVDIVTFPVPFPKGWKGLMKPEYNPWVEEPVEQQPPERQPAKEQTAKEQPAKAE